MKRLITIILILAATATMAQKTISNPGVVLDTTLNGHHYIFKWNGWMKFLPADSVYNDTIGSYTNPAYLSVKYSYANFQFTKQHIATVGSTADTVTRTIVVTIPLYDIVLPMNDLLTNTKLRKQFRQSLKTEYKKKLSQE